MEIRLKIEDEKVLILSSDRYNFILSIEKPTKAKDAKSDISKTVIGYPANIKDALKMILKYNLRQSDANEIKDLMKSINSTLAIIEQFKTIKGA
jgi:hypothetical protein